MIANAEGILEVKPTIPTATRLDSVRFRLRHLLPNYLEGTFLRNRFWFGLLSRLIPTPYAVKFGNRMRTKYGSAAIFIRSRNVPLLVISDETDLKRVFDNSPDRFADPDPKRRGMSHFQPDAVTISRNPEWQDRRAFNEYVLHDQKLDDSCRELARREAACLVREAGTRLIWDDFERMFGRIARQIIFGSKARDDIRISSLLRRLMLQANRLFLLRKGRRFRELHDRIDRYFSAPEPGSRISLAANAPASAITKARSQVPHWMFAMTDTLAANTARALVLILQNDEISTAIRSSIEKGIPNEELVQSCLQEAMRLFPTTPSLVRESLITDILHSGVVPAGTQVHCLNLFNHRDELRVPDANRFCPKRWMSGDTYPLFNHFGSGKQVCPGQHLALIIGASVLIGLLKAGQLTVVRPKISVSNDIAYRLNFFSVCFSVQKKSPGQSDST